MADFNSIYTGQQVDDILTGAKNLKTINIADAGAVEGGSQDCTSALQNIIDSEGSHVCIYIPQGDWLFEGNPYFNYHGVYIRGAASRATKILFQPSADGACFEWNSSEALEQSPGGCFDMSFWSGDAQYKKTAIKMSDGSNFDIRDVTIGGTHPTVNQYHWTDNSGESIGLDIFGREVISFDNIRIFADNPIKFGPTPNHADLDCDQFHVSNTYLVAPIGSPNSLITIRDETELKNFTIDGYNAWARGRCGVYWESTNNTSVSFHVKFSNIRCEQGEQASGETYSIYINHHVHNIEWMILEQIRCDLGRKHGIYMRGADNVRMADIGAACGVYVPVGEPLNIQHNSNNKCKTISWVNCNFGHYGGTSILPKDLMLVKGIDNPRSDCELPITADYVKRETNTYEEGGKIVAEDLRLIRFAKTLVAPQTGQATFNASSKTITALSGLDFSNIDYDTLIYLNTANNPHRFYTLTINSTSSVLEIEVGTVVDEVNVPVTIIHGVGLYHNAKFSNLSKASISLYAENEIAANRVMHLEFLNGKTVGTDNTSMNITHPSIFYIVSPYLGDQVPPADRFSVIGETQPVRVWNNRTSPKSDAKLIIEQLNF